MKVKKNDFIVNTDVTTQRHHPQPDNHEQAQANAMDQMELKDSQTSANHANGTVTDRDSKAEDTSMEIDEGESADIHGSTFQRDPADSRGDDRDSDSNRVKHAASQSDNGVEQHPQTQSQPKLKIVVSAPTDATKASASDDDERKLNSQSGLGQSSVDHNHNADNTSSTSIEYMQPQRRPDISYHQHPSPPPPQQPHVSASTPRTPSSEPMSSYRLHVMADHSSSTMPEVSPRSDSRHTPNAPVNVASTVVRVRPSLLRLSPLEVHFHTSSIDDEADMNMDADMNEGEGEAELETVAQLQHRTKSRNSHRAASHTPPNIQVVTAHGQSISKTKSATNAAGSQPTSPNPHDGKASPSSLPPLIHCQQCDCSFDPIAFQSHVSFSQAPHSTAYQCSICQLWFGRMGAVIRHKQRQHRQHQQQRQHTQSIILHKTKHEITDESKHEDAVIAAGARKRKLSDAEAGNEDKKLATKRMAKRTSAAAPSSYPPPSSAVPHKLDVMRVSRPVLAHPLTPSDSHSEGGKPRNPTLTLVTKAMVNTKSPSSPALKLATAAPRLLPSATATGAALAKVVPIGAITTPVESMPSPMQSDVKHQTQTQAQTMPVIATSTQRSLPLVHPLHYPQLPSDALDETEAQLTRMLLMVREEKMRRQGCLGSICQQRARASIHSSSSTLTFSTPRVRSTVCLPCGHHCLCASCMMMTHECPVCGTAIEEYVAINMNEDRPASNQQEKRKEISMAAHAVATPYQSYATLAVSHAASRRSGIAAIQTTNVRANVKDEKLQRPQIRYSAASSTFALGPTTAAAPATSQPGAAPQRALPSVAESIPPSPCQLQTPSETFSSVAATIHTPATFVLHPCFIGNSMPLTAAANEATVTSAVSSHPPRPRCSPHATSPSADIPQMTLTLSDRGRATVPASACANHSHVTQSDSHAHVDSKTALDGDGGKRDDDDNDAAATSSNTYVGVLNAATASTIATVNDNGNITSAPRPDANDAVTAARSLPMTMTMTMTDLPQSGDGQLQCETQNQSQRQRQSQKRIGAATAAAALPQSHLMSPPHVASPTTDASPTLSADLSPRTSIPDARSVVPLSFAMTDTSPDAVAVTTSHGAHTMSATATVTVTSSSPSAHPSPLASRCSCSSSSPPPSHTHTHSQSVNVSMLTPSPPASVSASVPSAVSVPMILTMDDIMRAAREAQGQGQGQGQGVKAQPQSD